MTRSINEPVSVALSEPRSRSDLLLETIALHHQIAVLKRSGTRRPCFRGWDRLFWILLSWWWPRWRQALMIVQPETVVRWRRDVWSTLWRYRSRGRWRGGRPRVAREVRELIVRMARENFTWGAPRIHGELRILGFEVSQTSVSRYLSTIYRPRGQSWTTFIRNQAMAFRLNQSLEQDSYLEFPDRWNGSGGDGEAERAGLNAARSGCSATSRYSIAVQRPSNAYRRSRNQCRHHFPIQVSMRSPPYHGRASPRLPSRVPSVSTDQVLRRDRKPGRIRATRWASWARRQR
jgi:hypothetical protein